MKALAVCVVFGLSLSLVGTCFGLAIRYWPMGWPACNTGSSVTCPAGDMGWFLITVEEIPPSPGTPITCRAFGPFAFGAGQNPQTVAQDSSGSASFTFINVGGCGNIMFQATSPTSPAIGTLPVFNASPDIDGDGMVNLSDFILFAEAYMTTNACCDFDCDGVVSLTDFIVFAEHYGHFC